MSLHKHRSRFITDGLARAPQRAFLRATGLDERDFDKSFVGIVTTAGENTPCSMSLAPQADQARLGVAAGGGVPVAFSTVSVSDGTSMNHGGMRMSLLSRELIADSVELAVRAHGYDALIGFGGCDKTLPALMMAMVRLNVPSVFLYGGAMLPGRDNQGHDASILQVIEGVGSVQTGQMDESQLQQLERSCTPTVGSCAGQFTANTMAMVGEALGLSPLGSAMIPAVYSLRLALARRMGEAVMTTLDRGGPLPRELVTRTSLENACAAVAATGGSTNAALLKQRTPWLCQDCHSTDHSGPINSGANLPNGAATTINGRLPAANQAPRTQTNGRNCLSCHAMVHGSNHPAGARFQR